MNTNSSPSLPAQDVVDLIHRLSTESKKVLAIFFDTRIGVCTSVVGTMDANQAGIKIQPVGPQSILETPAIITSFEALLRVPSEFFDPRMFNDGPFAAFFAREVPFSFGLVFRFPTGPVLCLMEVG